MSISNAPIFNTNIFNNEAFQDSTTILSIENADTRYLKLIGGTLTGALNIFNINNTVTNQTFQRWTNNIAIPINTNLQMSSTSIRFGSTSNHKFGLMSNNLERLLINTNGNISIGNNSNTYNLDITGTTISDIFRVRGGSVDFLIDSITGVGGSDSGLRIYPNSQGILTYSNMSFFNTDKSINIATISLYNQNCFHARPKSADIGIDMLNVGFVSGVDAIFREALMITSNSLTNIDNRTPVTKFNITADNQFTDGTYNKALRITNANFGNRFEIQIGNTTGDSTFIGNTSNTDLRFGTNNSTKMILTNSGRLGLGITSPSCGLDIAIAENTVTTTTNPLINTFSYNVSTNTFNNMGGGPVSVNMCARFRGSVWIQDKIYATSDRRLKSDIKMLDFTLEHYNKLNPVSYKWKNQNKINLGLIAQEVKNICAESINIVENDNMKKIDDDDLEKMQYTVDYNCINMMNVVAIKKLIKRINILEDKLNRRFPKSRFNLSSKEEEDDF